MTKVEQNAWNSFVLVVKEFLGRRRAENYMSLVETMLANFQGIGPRMSIKLHYLICYLDHFPEILGDVSRASERTFLRVYEGRYRAPKSYWAPQALSGPMPLNHFLSDGCRSSFKSEGITIYCTQLGPMKNTTRHKIRLNPARGSGGVL